MKTLELIGAKLDYWTAVAIGIDQRQAKIQDAQRSDKEICVLYGISRYAPSEDWNVVGPLIDKYAVMLTKSMSGRGWIAHQEENNISGDYAYGATPLVAACRAIVLSRFGAEAPEVSQ